MALAPSHCLPEGSVWSSRPCQLWARLASPLIRMTPVLLLPQAVLESHSRRLLSPVLAFSRGSNPSLLAIPSAYLFLCKLFVYFKREQVSARMLRHVPLCEAKRKIYKSQFFPSRGWFWGPAQQVLFIPEPSHQ